MAPNTPKCGTIGCRERSVAGTKHCRLHQYLEPGSLKPDPCTEHSIPCTVAGCTNMSVTTSDRLRGTDLPCTEHALHPGRGDELAWLEAELTAYALERNWISSGMSIKAHLAPATYIATSTPIDPEQRERIAKIMGVHRETIALDNLDFAMAHPPLDSAAARFPGVIPEGYLAGTRAEIVFTDVAASEPAAMSMALDSELEDTIDYVDEADR